MAEVVPYREEWRGEFERLNREWIEEWFTLEPADAAVFRDPVGKILAPGGQIFFVLEHDVVLGTCAVLGVGSGVFEIAKMAVAPSARGRGYGGLLMEAAMSHVRQAGGGRIVIVSNTRLGPAIRLYQKHGFVRVPLTADDRYVRADIRLERDVGPPE